MFLAAVLVRLAWLSQSAVIDGAGFERVAFSTARAISDYP